MACEKQGIVARCPKKNHSKKIAQGIAAERGPEKNWVWKEKKFETASSKIRKTRQFNSP